MRQARQLVRPGQNPADNPSPMSTAGSALGLLGRCGKIPAKKEGNFLKCMKPQNVACPACALSFLSVVVIRMVLSPALSLNCGVTVW